MGGSGDDNVVSLIDREEAIFKARLSGKSVRRIAQEFHTDVPQVEAIIERMCPTIDTQMRAVALALDLERLDELQETFYSDAVKGDVQAAAIFEDRRASQCLPWHRCSGPRRSGAAAGSGQAATDLDRSH